MSDPNSPADIRLPEGIETITVSAPYQGNNLPGYVQLPGSGWSFGGMGGGWMGGGFPAFPLPDNFVSVPIRPIEPTPEVVVPKGTDVESVAKLIKLKQGSITKFIGKEAANEVGAEMATTVAKQLGLVLLLYSILQEMPGAERVDQAVEKVLFLQKLETAAQLRLNLGAYQGALANWDRLLEETSIQVTNHLNGVYDDRGFNNELAKMFENWFTGNALNIPEIILPGAPLFTPEWRPEVAPVPVVVPSPFPNEWIRVDPSFVPLAGGAGSMRIDITPAEQPSKKPRWREDPREEVRKLADPLPIYSPWLNYLTQLQMEAWFRGLPDVDIIPDLNISIRPSPSPAPAPRPAPSPEPAPDPGISIDIGVRPYPTGRPEGLPGHDAREHRHRRNEEKTKSQLRYVAVMRFITKTWGKLTEVGDLGKAVLGSFHVDGQRYSNGQYVRYKRWDVMYSDFKQGRAIFDPEELVLNVLKNEFGDRMVAAINKGHAKQRLRAGHDINTGGTLGTWFSRTQRNVRP